MLSHAYHKGRVKINPTDSGPSASHAVNSMWMWGALLAYSLSARLQTLASLGTARHAGPAPLAATSCTSPPRPGS
jgi:hypothetical protein